MEELIFFMPVPMHWDQSSHGEVDDVCKLGNMTRYSKEMLVGKCVTDVARPLNVET